MIAIGIVLEVFQFLLILYFGVSALYIFILSIAGHFRMPKRKAIQSLRRRFALLIPGYKEDSVIVDTAQQALQQDYPTPLFDVIIIADSFQPETIKKLKQLPVKLFEVTFDVSTKAKALNKALELLPDNYYDVAVVLDADNIMEYNLLEKFNKSFDAGFRVIQAHRIAKNLNTTMALLDAISEEINNHLFRKGHRVLGLSSALIGSGMAFEYGFLKQMMANVSSAGEDKEIEMILTRDKQQIEYLEDAYVLDEKVSNSQVFSNQRRRWLSVQFEFFVKSFFPSLIDLFTKGNIDYFLKSFQMMQPPRIFLLGFSWLFTIISVFFLSDVFTPLWVSIFFMTNIAILISIPKKFWNRRLITALLCLPKGLLMMLVSLFKLKGAGKKFIHTPHGQDKE
jgi:cellulose synthase/poly-beta-1,6-N-acetylglucosamine synthase-like glycosyltransferase